MKKTFVLSLLSFTFLFIFQSCNKEDAATTCVCITTVDGQETGRETTSYTETFDCGGLESSSIENGVETVVTCMEQ